MIRARICGIPCLVKMTSGSYIKPWRGGAHTAPSDIDYYGGWQGVEFEVYDLRERPAPWLRRKMTSQDESRIVDELCAAAEDDL